MGNNGTGIKISVREHTRGHQFSFESASGMRRNGNRRDKMGKIQSHFSRASFPLMLGQVPARIFQAECDSPSEALPPVDTRAAPRYTRYRQMNLSNSRCDRDCACPPT